MIIDEAGMADTRSLATAVTFIVRRGSSIRLVGDDQQLAAVGAGGVLRDIQASYGAVRLTELHRFTDPTEAAATLARRDGRPEALGFYPTGDAWPRVLQRVENGGDRCVRRHRRLHADIVARTDIQRGWNIGCRDQFVQGRGQSSASTLGKMPCASRRN